MMASMVVNTTGQQKAQGKYPQYSQRDGTHVSGDPEMSR